MLTKEELIDTYLLFKYNPISEETFNKIIEKLEKYGFEKGNSILYSKVTDANYLFIGIDMLLINSGYVAGNLITVQDILSLEEMQQYLPKGHIDKKSIEFKLPDRWKIKFDNNWDILSKFKPFGDTYSGNLYIGGYYAFDSTNKEVDCCSQKSDNNYIEITIDQFKKYVLKTPEPLISTKEDFDADDVTEEVCKHCERYILESGTRSDSKGNMCEGCYCEQALESFNEVKKENMDKIAVSLPTQEKWNFFLSKFNPKGLSNSLWERGYFVIIKHPKEAFIGTETDDKNWLIKQGYTLITFEGWLKNNNYTFSKPKDFQAIEIAEFKVGDRVKIINKGCNYANYTIAFQAIGFKDIKINGCINGDTGTIFHICKHPESYINLVSINLDNGKQCLIDSKGIEKISEYIPKTGDYIRYLGTKESKTDERWEDYFGKYIKKYDVGIIKESGKTYHLIEGDGRPDNNGYLTKEDFTIITKEEYLRDRPFNGKSYTFLKIDDLEIVLKDSKGISSKKPEEPIYNKLDNNQILPPPAIREVIQPSIMKEFKLNKELKSYKFINKIKNKNYVKKEFKLSSSHCTIQTR